MTGDHETWGNSEGGELGSGGGWDELVSGE